MLQYISDDEFQAVVLDSTRPVLLEFTAEWCGPCRSLKPVLEKLAEKHAGEVVFVVLDIDQHIATAQRYKILSIPTILAFNGGEVVGTLEGVGRRPELEIESLIARAGAEQSDPNIPL